MVSFEVRRKLRTAASALVLAAAPHTGFSQPLLDSNAADDLTQIVDEIREEQSQDPYSEDLIDLFKTLGLLYQESGDHGLAAVAIERAVETVRANYGLHTLDQAPLIRQQIHNEEARGNFAAAWELEQELLALLRRHPTDLRTVPILREIGDKRMDMLSEYVSGEFPPQIILGCYYYSDIGSCHAGSRKVVIQQILSEAWSKYSDAIDILLRHELYESDELRELEMELLRSSYQHRNYALGRRSLRRLVAYDVATSEPWLGRVEALVQIADWELLFTRNGAAIEIYEYAYQRLKEEGIADASIEEIFSPETPVVLPAFLPNPLVTEKTRHSTGYIDVAFEITKYGKSRQIEILDMTPDVTDAAKDALVLKIKRSEFRPRPTDGQFTRTSPIVVRYYVNE